MNPLLILKKTIFTIFFIYASHWDKWIREVEHEAEMNRRRNVLKKRRQ